MLAASYGPMDAIPWEGQPEKGWLPELIAPLDGVVLGVCDLRILGWAASTLDWPTLRVLVSLLHRARSAAPLTPTDDGR